MSLYLKNHIPAGEKIKDKLIGRVSAVIPIVE
jgi:hypothetical protein